MHCWTGGDDYSPLTVNIEFPQAATTPQTMCTPITILDDSALESEERFFIVLQASDVRVIITEENGRASVLISDNDGGESEYL